VPRRPPIDLRFLDRALALAERGRYTVSPNPLVGAVVVRRGRVVGEGHHRRAGGPHAEVEALEQAGPRARGADLYVSLEPCPHFGRTPPCTDAILSAGIARVIVAARDASPPVSGKGLARLAARRVRVLSGSDAQRAAAERQNEKFFVWASQRRPFVLAKWAETLDGRTADGRGRSRWITGPLARERALLLREEYDAVLVGAGTVLADDPRLTRRLGLNRATAQRRIVLDGRLRTPAGSALLRDPDGVVLATALPVSHPRARRLARLGAAIWSLPGTRPGRCSIRALLSRLAREEISSVLVEGGAQTLWEFFRARAVDRASVFLAPRILGGERSPGGVGGAGYPLGSTPWLAEAEVERLGPDLLVTGRIARPASG
jgi:diaminohydroxyphosphoribosylaminopyrimidine deaminase/5-amino-6-(5-phosphoribosylamino)uracil reductase